uniref:Uncharacterized protein n=1 Tax=Palpitomonas bilix TaxID=652834 RepID=A0A7S3LWV9_9EUKA
MGEEAEKKQDAARLFLREGASYFEDASTWSWLRAYANAMERLYTAFCSSVEVDERARDEEGRRRSGRRGSTFSVKHDVDIGAAASYNSSSTPAPLAPRPAPHRSPSPLSSASKRRQRAMALTYDGLLRFCRTYRMLPSLISVRDVELCFRAAKEYQFLNYSPSPPPTRSTSPYLYSTHSTPAVSPPQHHLTPSPPPPLRSPSPSIPLHPSSSLVSLSPASPIGRHALSFEQFLRCFCLLAWLAYGKNTSPLPPQQRLPFFFYHLYRTHREKEKYDLAPNKGYESFQRVATAIRWWALQPDAEGQREGWKWKRESRSPQPVPFSSSSMTAFVESAVGLAKQGDGERRVKSASKVEGRRERRRSVEEMSGQRVRHTFGSGQRLSPAPTPPSSSLRPRTPPSEFGRNLEEVGNGEVYNPGQRRHNLSERLFEEKVGEAVGEDGGASRSNSRRNRREETGWMEASFRPTSSTPPPASSLPDTPPVHVAASPSHKPLANEGEYAREESSVGSQELEEAQELEALIRKAEALLSGTSKKGIMVEKLGSLVNILEREVQRTLVHK